MVRNPTISLMVALTLFSAACRQQQVDYEIDDVRLSRAVKEQFEANANTKGVTSRVNVSAKDNTVTLTGTVDTPQDKTTAEQLARMTPGVKNVVNEISVSAATLPVPDEPLDEQKVRSEAAANGERIGPSSEDAAIYHNVRRHLVKYESTPKRAIFVDVVDGDVTLRGTIFTTAARDKAVAIAKKIDGVIGVRDSLVVNSPLP